MAKLQALGSRHSSLPSCSARLNLNSFFEVFIETYKLHFLILHFTNFYTANPLLLQYERS